MTKEGLIESLIKDGYLKTPRLIEAFRNIDRKNFVPEGEASEAYGNYPLPIGFGQTISQPLTVAFMLELLEPKPGEKILDIGSGSGWQTALLGFVIGAKGRVVAIERIPELKEMTEKNVGKYNFIDPVRNRARAGAPEGPLGRAVSNGVDKGIVKAILGDGSKGYPDEAPYNKIIAAAAGDKIPEEWKSQLKVGGRIVAPVGNSIMALDKVSEDKFEIKEYFGFSFVPLVRD